MSDALNFAEIDGQHVELLPARTVMSLFAVKGGDGGKGGNGFGGIAALDQLVNANVLGEQSNSAADGTGGPGGSAHGGRG